jgi:RNA polymerase sigma-70 factor (ECF subfamily)
VLEDSRTVTLVKNGDADSFADIVERYQTPIFRYLYRLTGNHELALDLRQDTFIQAFKGIRKTDISVSFKSWLYRIATNCALQHLRRKRRILFLPLREEDNGQRGDDRSGSMDEQMTVRDVLARIPAEQRVCLVLHYIEGLKYREIGEVLGISEEAVRKRVSRGSLEFRKLYTAGEVA